MFNNKKTISRKGDKTLSTFNIYWNDTKEILCRFDLIYNESKLEYKQLLRYRVQQKQFPKFLLKDPDFFSIYGLIIFLINNPLQPKPDDIENIKNFTNWTLMKINEMIFRAGLEKKISIKIGRIIKKEK